MRPWRHTRAHTVGIDGRHRRRLVANVDGTLSALWSPDGRRIAYYQVGTIRVVAAGGVSRASSVAWRATHASPGRPTERDSRTSSTPPSARSSSCGSAGPGSSSAACARTAMGPTRPRGLPTAGRSPTTDSPTGCSINIIYLATGHIACCSSTQREEAWPVPTEARSRTTTERTSSSSTSRHMLGACFGTPAGGHVVARQQEAFRHPGRCRRGRSPHGATHARLQSRGERRQRQPLRRLRPMAAPTRAASSCR